MKVDVIPDQPQELGDPQAAEESGLDQDPTARGAGIEQALDLTPPQDSLATALRPRPLLWLEQIDGVDG